MKKAIPPSPRPKTPTPKAKTPAKPKPRWVVQFWTGEGAQPFYARLASARNGQPISTSEGYTTKAARTSTWRPIAEKLECEIEQMPNAPLLQKAVPQADVEPTSSAQQADCA
jgi:hypothetical protein